MLAPEPHYEVDGDYWENLSNELALVAFACHRIENGRKSAHDSDFLVGFGKRIEDYLDGVSEINLLDNTSLVYEMAALLRIENGKEKLGEREKVTLEQMSEDFLSAKDLDVFADKADYYNEVFWALHNTIHHRKRYGPYLSKEENVEVGMNHGRRVELKENG